MLHLTGEIMKSLAIGILLALGLSSAVFACEYSTCVSGNIKTWSISGAEGYGDKVKTEALSAHQGMITSRDLLGKKDPKGSGYDVTVLTSGASHAIGKEFAGARVEGDGGFLIQLPKMHSFHH
jgi:hypothetical protein